MLTPQEAEAVLTLSLMAAFVDGQRAEEERKRVSEIGTNLGIASYADIMARVALKQVNVDDVIRQISSDEGKILAYEMAAYVCDADGAVNAEERQFLQTLQQGLGLQSAKAATVQIDAEKVVSVPVHTDPSAIPLEPNDAETDRMVLNYAILNGALELLPQSLATLAIIPVQMRMVYRIGQRNGVQLDQGHVKEFLATVGISLTAQMVEGFARRVLGQIGRTVGGKMVGKAVDAATGAAMTFATTYALGHVAQAYYAGGRRMDMPQLQSIFRNLLEEGKSLFSRYSSDIAEKARTISLNDLIPIVRGR
jgi:uncharacterized protein (DUF697 family)/tellurite resistance protein